ncbi:MULTISPECIES: hypothetical protein [unclassified Modicisalibacter]|uniref:hypothetical protein n=1 Tax=unclassified Modicisalibacter TaxID=2679913 RepID=UPI001CCB6314|nr:MULTISPECIES: hypothetical protein [unclassified Modicisalibacter]MBZ9557115.1 hypothetical protein [Modicisalibacter sp. R2A 31.J]MBZ9574171.1 hypothetical protein [Modicisalibacter sp. MOD 31.J]
MLRDDVPGWGVYRHSDGKLVKRCNTLAELVHEEPTNEPMSFSAFLDKAGYRPYETVADAYTVHVSTGEALPNDAYRTALEGVRYLIEVKADTQSGFYVLVDDNLTEYLIVLDLLQPLATHKRWVADGGGAGAGQA